MLLHVVLTLSVLIFDFMARKKSDLFPVVALIRAQLAKGLLGLIEIDLARLVTVPRDTLSAAEKRLGGSGNLYAPCETRGDEG